MIAAAAWILAGVAFWFSRSVLDVFEDAGRITRVAMLPSLPELYGLIVLMLIAAGGVAWRVSRWTSSPEERAEALLQISLPLFGLIVTIVPYLPWLPDAVAPLRALAGPVVGLIWFVIAGQVALTFLGVRSSFIGAARYDGRGIPGAALAAILTAALGTLVWLRVRGTLTGVALTSEGLFTQSHPAAWIAMTAVTAFLTWRWAFAFTGSGAASAFAWTSIFVGAPMLFTGVSGDAAIPAALSVLVAFAWKTAPQDREAPWPEYLVRGLAISALPWLSLTYVPMAGVLAALLGLRAIKHPRAVLAVMVPCTVSSVRRLVFPNQPLAFGNPIVGVLGLLVDQEFGVLPYVPAVAIGLVALWQMTRSRDWLVRRRGREVGVLFGVLLVSAGTIMNWWSTFAPPGRALVPVLPLLGLPLAWTYALSPASSVRRSLYHLLALIGVAITLAITFSNEGGLIVQDRDGSSRLLQWLTSLWPAWQMAPAIAASGLRASAAVVVLWMAAAAAAAWLSRRNPSSQPGVSALTATIDLGAAILIVAILAPAVTAAEPPSVTRPQARSRLPMLDNFDSVARPHAIVYRPFMVTHAADVPPLLTLAAEPGLRSGGQPVPVLLNARYALAAGDYVVEVGGLHVSGPVEGTLGLQVGRIGRPMREWHLMLAPGQIWRGQFSLPVDAEFVGLVASDSLSSASVLRIMPVRIIDKNNRESSFHGTSRVVLSAIQGPSASVFFHDEDVYPEGNGFWVHGESSALMTIAPIDPERGVTLRVHSGSVPNTVTFATPTWGERVALVPTVSRDIHVPAPARPGPFLLKVTTDKGFVPADVTPGNTDRRFLGCWIEPVQE